MSRPHQAKPEPGAAALHAGLLFAGKYELLRPLGRGGMAQVWLAHKHGHAGVKKVCALKMPPDLIGASELQRDAIFNEAKLGLQLSHSNIVQVVDFGEHAGVVYLELERIDGIDLAQFLGGLRSAGERLSMAMAVYVVGSILEGLRYAHEFAIDGRRLGIMHRDLTPSNVIVSSAGEVKIMDFGIGKSVDDQTSRQHIKGKVRYMSPEQAGGDASQQCDLFAVGAIFYELVEGRKFRDEIRHDLLLAALDGKSPRLQRPDVPGELRVFYDGLVAKRRDRFASAAEAIARLASWQGGRATAADLRALYAVHLGRLPRSGYTEADLEIPEPLRALLAALDHAAMADAAGGGVGVAAAPAASVEPNHAVPERSTPSLTEPAGPQDAAPKQARTEVFGRPRVPAPAIGTAAASAAAPRVPASAAAGTPRTAMGVGQAGAGATVTEIAVTRTASAIGWRRWSWLRRLDRRSGARAAWAAFAALAIVLLVAVILRWERWRSAIDVDERRDADGPELVEASAVERDAAELSTPPSAGTAEPLPPSSEVAAIAARPIAAAPAAASPSAGNEPAPTTVPSAAPDPAPPGALAADPGPAIDPVAPNSASALAAVSPEPLPKPAKPAPQPWVKVRFTQMMATGEVKVDGRIYVIGDTIDTRLRAGSHAFAWRRIGETSWHRLPKLRLAARNSYVIHMRSNGPMVGWKGAGE
ncbi:MAG: serine/threonine protein kinase [Nannocystaceae bacterium]|nr:serine/threonine protein kinase [Deltaproteobacteria bacterium]MBP7291749.1 serine/threonine protein kinase [Nannocystaceae bacterium]